MKRNVLTLIAGSVLLLIFGLLLFTFQVRTTEVAVVTTFGKPTREITEPRAWPYFKLPWPVQKVHKLDKRVQNLEDRFEETITPDGFNLMVSVFAGWRISEPGVFFPKFAGGSVAEAEKALEAVVRSAKNEVVGQHPFPHFVNADEKELRLSAIESEILGKAQDQIRAANYGMEIVFLGIRRLGIPEGVTQTVFDRMKSERQVLVSKIENEGKEQAQNIRSAAEREAAILLANAEADATRILGEGEAAAAKSFGEFRKNPELANLLFKLNALESVLKEKTTLILDQNTPPLDLLQKTGPGK